MIGTNEIEELLVNHDIFQGMVPAQLRWLLQVAKYHEMRRGEVLFERGQSLDCMYVLLTGHVKMVIPASDAQEKVVEFLRPGDILGEAALTPQGCTVARAQALTVGRYITMDLDVLSVVLQKVPYLAVRILTKMAQRLQEQMEGLESVAFKSAAQRVAEYVLRQPRFGDQARFMYHKRSIASKLGLQPETFSRSLSQLAREGLISVQGARITIHDEARLRALSS